MNRNAVCGCAVVTLAEANETELVAAGHVCTSNICGDVLSDGTNLAQLMMENQEYVEGYCPSDALERGTMFPGLVM